MKLTKFDKLISQKIIDNIIFESWELIEQKIKESLKNIIYGWYNFNIKINEISHEVMINFTYCPSEFSMKTLSIKVGGEK